MAKIDVASLMAEPDKLSRKQSSLFNTHSLPILRLIGHFSCNAYRFCWLPRGQRDILQLRDD